MIKYIDGMKYQLVEDVSAETPVKGYVIVDPMFSLDLDGTMTIRAGYAWDGASGPTVDTKSSMTASLFHDVFCVLMRDGRISYNEWQDRINDFFREQCIKSGMWPWRADVWHFGVEFGDAGNPTQGPDRIVKVAP